MKIKIIAAIGKNKELGTDENQIPWAFHPEDMQIFAAKTKSEGGIVVMGRKTYESIPSKFKPLKDRRNIVITRDSAWKSDGVETFNSVKDVVGKFKNEETLWILGGGEIYRQFLNLADELHISHFNISPENATIFFPEIDLSVWKESEIISHKETEKSPAFTHKVYRK